MTVSALHPKAKPHQLPEVRDVRPKPPPRVISDPHEIAAFLSSRFG